MKGNLHRRWETRIDDIQSINFFVDGADGIPDSDTSGQKLAASETHEVQETYLILG